MTALRVFQSLDFVDYDGADVVQLHAFSKHVVHTFVGSHNNSSAGTAVADRSGFGEVQTGSSRHNGGLGNSLVLLGEAVVLLVCKSNQRDKEKHSSPLFQIVLETCHLTDEGLTRCGSGYHQQVFAVQESCLNGELLCRH